jgi:hypothetical protein
MHGSAMQYYEQYQLNIENAHFSFPPSKSVKIGTIDNIAKTTYRAKTGKNRFRGRVS